MVMSPEELQVLQMIEQRSKEQNAQEVGPHMFYVPPSGPQVMDPARRGGYRVSPPPSFGYELVPGGMPTPNPQPMLPNPKGGYTVATRPPNLAYNPEDMYPGEPVAQNKAEAATILGIDFGGFKAQQKNKNQGLLSPEESTGDASFSIDNLLGGVKDVVNDPFIATLLQIAAQPEAFTDPRGLGAGIATAGQNVFAAQAAQQKAEADRQLEYDKLRVQMAKSGKRPEFKQFMAKMVSDVRQQKQGLDTVQKIKRLLGKEGAGGIAGAFKSFVSDAGAIFGASGGQSVNQQIQKYNAYLLSSLGSGIASGQISQEDYKRIDAMLKNPDIFTDADKLLDAYNDVERIIGNAYQANADMLREVGYGNLIQAKPFFSNMQQVPD
jgi:hypothetical protein